MKTNRRELSVVAIALRVIALVAIAFVLIQVLLPVTLVGAAT